MSRQPAAKAARLEHPARREQTNLGEGDVGHQLMRRRTALQARSPRTRRAMTVVGLAVLLVALMVPAVGAHPIDPDWAPPFTVYIPETGQTIDRLFLDQWRGGGGALSYGNPVTAEITEADGHVVQYYEYARFEYWPDGDAEGNYVTLGRIGAELGPPMLPRRASGLSAAKPFRRSPASGTAGATAMTARAWLPRDQDGAPSAIADWRYVRETKHGVWGLFRAFWVATGEAAYLGNPLTEEYEVDGVTYQVFERGQLAWEPGKDPWMVPVGALLTERYGIETGPEQQGTAPIYDEALFIPPITAPDISAAPPPIAGAAKSIVVSLGQQALWAYEGDKAVKSTYVSTGKERFETPPGLFYVNTKLPVQDMAGVIGGEYYNVPKVPNVMYFTDRGHALHGTYWHDNFGEPMSHGCVNLPMDVAQWLYGWAGIGTPVWIVP